MRIRRKLTVVIAMAVAALGAMAAPGSAAQADGVKPSTRQAGYVVTGESLHAISAGWTQPTVSCTSTNSYARIQVGFSSAHGRIAVGTAFNCIDGHPVGYVTGTVFGHHKVFPGDHMSMTMNYYRGSLEVEIDDDTQGWGQGAAIDSTGGPRMIHANFVVLRKTGDDGDLPLANFHQASFDNCKVGGDFIDQRQPDAFQMVNGSGVVRATPGELDDTGDFTVTWKHR